MICRLAAIADLHADERERLDDLRLVLDAFISQARAAKVDAVAIAGDLYERRSTPAERNLVARFVLDCAEFAPVYICKGNHDVDGDLDILRELGGVWPINVETGATAMPESATIIGPFGFLALSWFDKAHLVSSADATEGAASTTERTIQAARGLLTALRAEAGRAADAGVVPILVGHVLVAGSETSTGQTLIGTTVELSPGDLADVGCAYVALGHIHKAQSWGRVAYSGSPQRNNFGEPEAKGWNLVTIDTERWREPDGVTVEFRELPARRIVLEEYDWTDKSPVLWISRAEVAGALVRCRYRVHPENLHLVNEEDIAGQYRDAGAHEVKIEAVLEHTERVRAAAIVEARDTWEKLVSYWAAAGIDVPEAQRERLRAKLDELETRQRQEVAA
jgi:exonuclease SbcD